MKSSWSPVSRLPCTLQPSCGVGISVHVVSCTQTLTVRTKLSLEKVGWCKTYMCLLMIQMWVQTQGISLPKPLRNLVRFKSNLIWLILNCNFWFLFLTCEKVYMKKIWQIFSVLPIQKLGLLSWFIHQALLAIEYIALSYFKNSHYCTKFAS